MDEQLKKQSFVGFAWRFLQNSSAKIISFVIQIVLARILLPDDYGLISLTTVFIAISNVFVQSGLTSGLVQKKEISELDKSSMFYISIGLGLILYLILFLVSPLISSFYKTPEFTNVLRVHSLTIIFSSISSVSIALIQRELKFKKTFLVGIIGHLFQGAVGIFLALKGYGVWALVFGILSYNLVYSVGCCILCKWLPKFTFSFKSAKGLMQFSINVLFSNLAVTIFSSIKSLMIGKVYSKEALGYYDRGNQFPNAMMSGFDGAFTSVLYSSLSRIQDDKEKLLNYLRKSIKTSIFITTPMMFGLAAVSKPLVLLLLTEKWISCVPFLMVCCGLCLFWPLSAKTHALNALGKSRITFFTNLATIIINVLIMMVLMRFDILIFAVGLFIGDFLCSFIPVFMAKKYLRYKVSDQIFDVFPTFFAGGIMFAFIYKSSVLLNIHPALELLILIPVGVILYSLLSLVLNLDGAKTIISFTKNALQKHN